MLLSRTLPLAWSPANAVRQALIGSLYKAHRPELADVVASADLAADLAVDFAPESGCGRSMGRSARSGWKSR